MGFSEYSHGVLRLVTLQAVAESAAAERAHDASVAAHAAAQRRRGEYSEHPVSTQEYRVSTREYPCMGVHGASVVAHAAAQRRRDAPTRSACEYSEYPSGKSRAADGAREYSEYPLGVVKGG